jgi:hypothetical protein
MSQLKVDTITDEAGTGSPSLPNGLTVGGVNYPTTGPLSNRNKIINGAMVIDQRNAGAAVTPAASNSFGLDRWFSGWSSPFNSRFTFQQNAGSVTPPLGFTNYLGTTVASAYTPAATEFSFIQQPIEGFNFADLGWGAAGAQSVTLSFWARSSLTGTFPVVVGNDYARGYGATYTINSANTWEYKTITVPGDTTGTWGKTNGIGLRLLFSLGTGATASQPAGVWGAWVGPGVPGTVLLSSTNGATFYITGVQLEAGTVATPFEHRSFGQELALCKRYFERINYPAPEARPVTVGHWYQTVGCHADLRFDEKRAVPTCSLSSPSHFGVYVGANLTAATSINLVQATVKTVNFNPDAVLGGGIGTVNAAVLISKIPEFNAYVDISAEL